MAVADGSVARTISPASKGKAPRTARGEKTLRKILDAALRRIRPARISRQLDRRHHQPRQGRAGHLLHLFRQQGGGVRAPWSATCPGRSATMSLRTSKASTDEIDRERRALASYLRFVFEHKEVYRIIDEAEFVDPAGFRTHYETAAARIATRLEEAVAKRRDARRRAAGHGSPRLGDHGNERVPRPALRGVGPPGCRAGRGPRQRACCARA